MFATTKQTYSELWSNCRKEKEKKSTLWKVARYCFGSLQVIKSSKKQSQGLFWLDANIGAISSKLHVTNTRFKNAPPNPVFKSDVIIRFWFQTLLLVPKSNEHGSIIESYKLSKFFIIKKNIISVAALSGLQLNLKFRYPAKQNLLRLTELDVSRALAR